MKKRGVSVFIVKDPQDGISLAKKIIYKNSDNQTVLFLSGGSTPKPLYQALAKEKKLSLGGAGVIDERYGQPYHENSNEKMIKESGILDYFKNKNIKFHKILKNKESLKNTAIDYDEVVRKLLSQFPKKIAIMGIGHDGHTAGLAADRVQGSKSKVQGYVESVDSFPGKFKKRITLTFKSLGEMSLLIILAFGSDKKTALEAMFEEGSVNQIPARFYTQKNIVTKALLITDQRL